MVLKNVKSELEAVFKSLDVYDAAKKYLASESVEITDATRASISSSVLSTKVSGKERQDMLDDAEENAEKAGAILMRLQKRLKEDYGKFWRQDLISSAIFSIPEQEIVEAFALLAVLKQKEIPSRIINFRIQDPDSYLKTKTTLKVSGTAYLFGLLDCVGELGRVIHDSLDKPKFAIEIYKIMEDLFVELAVFTEFPNRRDPKTESKKHISNLKHRIDVCRSQVTKCREVLENIGAPPPKNGPYA